MADDRNIREYDDRARSARQHDDSSDAPRVAALSDLDDFQVVDGFPDPRGWDVLTSDGRKVGTVHDLIVDTEVLRTRYLDVTLDKDAIGASDDHDVLLPVGAARLDDDNDRVMLGSITERQLASLPAFEHGEITREYESSLIGRMPSGGAEEATRGAGAAAGGAAFYASQHFDDSRFYGTRRPTKKADQSRVVTRSEEEVFVVRKPMVADTKNLEADLRKEKIDVDRNVNRDEDRPSGSR